MSKKVFVLKKHFLRLGFMGFVILLAAAMLSFQPITTSYAVGPDRGPGPDVGRDRGPDPGPDPGRDIGPDPGVDGPRD